VAKPTLSPTRATATATDLLVVGLGNPGAEFEGSRHNVGFDVVDELARRYGGHLKLAKKDRALVDTVSIGGSRVALAAPITYMNESGQSVRPLLKRLDLDDLHRLVVVHDELDLPEGRLRVKVGGGLAGHNGLRSIKAHLHDDDFVRVRIGVGKPPSKEQGAHHVLKKVSKAERALLDQVVSAAADAVEAILAEGATEAMDRYNGWAPPA
jgi:PTH1 family peptidyl-tRNA hydrolase